MVLRGKIVNLRRADLLNEANEVCRIRQVAVVQKEARLLLVRIQIEIVDPLSIEG